MHFLEHAFDIIEKIVAAVAAALVTRRLAQPTPPALPLYTEHDADAALALLHAVPFAKVIEPVPGLRISLSPASHLLGAASVLCEAEGARPVTELFGAPVDQVPVGMFDVDAVQNGAQVYEVEIALVDDLQPGDVAVFACGGPTDRVAPWGELLSTAAQVRGAAGCLTDGLVRDTKAIRAGVLTDKHELKIASVDAEPAIDSKAWDNVPESFFRVHDGMPFANISTHMKLLHDKTHLYVRIDSLHPHVHPEDFYQREPDKDTFTQEYVELAIAPPNAGGKVYRIAANPVEGSRYDGVYTPGKRDLVEDKTWNGTWQFRFSVTGQKGPYSLPDRSWTAWFKIPFTDLGGTPKPGEVWDQDEDARRIRRQMRLIGAIGQVLEHMIRVAVPVAQLTAREAQPVRRRHHVDPGDRLRDARGDQQAQRAVGARRPIVGDVACAARQPQAMVVADEQQRAVDLGSLSAKGDVR